jgi:hypothetical protein
MKQLLSLSFIILCACLSAQSRLGYELDSIKTEYVNGGYQPTLGLTERGSLFLKIEFKAGEVIYHFNDNNICIMTIIQPWDERGINLLKEKYNKRLFIVSDKKWKDYSSNSINDIELIYPSADIYPYFTWTFSE